MAETAPAPATESQRSLPTPFLTKTYQLVEDPAVDDVISWNDDGSTFVVWRPAEFARDILPKYFKHNNFSSFVRQLNTYGFRKIVPDRWEFANDCFKKGEKRLLCDIHRRKISTPVVAPASVAASPPVSFSPSPGNSGEGQVVSANSSPSPTPPATRPPGDGSSSTADLIDENERLRKENSHLSRELSQMKSMCNNIFMMMSNYAFNPADGKRTPSPSPAPEEGKRTPALDLMPMKTSSSDGSSQDIIKVEEEEDNNDNNVNCNNNCPNGAMLFGVSIGLKRPRGEVDRTTAEGQRRKSLEVKSDPMDRDSDQEDGWMRCSHRSMDG